MRKKILNPFTGEFDYIYMSTDEVMPFDGILEVAPSTHADGIYYDLSARAFVKYAGGTYHGSWVGDDKYNALYTKLSGAWEDGQTASGTVLRTYALPNRLFRYDGDLYIVVQGHNLKMISKMYDTDIEELHTKIDSGTYSFRINGEKMTAAIGQRWIDWAGSELGPKRDLDGFKRFNRVGTIIYDRQTDMPPSLLSPNSYDSMSYEASKTQTIYNSSPIAGMEYVAPKFVDMGDAGWWAEFNVGAVESSDAGVLFLNGSPDPLADAALYRNFQQGDVYSDPATAWWNRADLTQKIYGTPTYVQWLELINQSSYRFSLSGITFRSYQTSNEIFVPYGSYIMSDSPSNLPAVLDLNRNISANQNFDGAFRPCNENLRKHVRPVYIPPVSE